MSKQDRFVWADWQLQALFKLFPDHTAKEIALVVGLDVERVNRKAHFLGLKKSATYIEALKIDTICRLNESGQRHRFEKGLVPWNKGVAIGSHPASVATQFKKGIRPHTWVPVGSYRINGDHFLELKFSDEPGSYTKRWIPVHRKLWIEANGPVPARHMVRFKEGLKTTVLEEITLDRIECISMAENLKRNSLYRYPKEIQDLMRARGLLKRAINKKERTSP